MESIGFACVVFWPIILVVILATSSIVATGGAIGLISDRKRRGAIWKKSIIALIIGLLPLFVCGLPLILPKPPPPTPTPLYKLADESIKPFLQAINQSNRLSYGFLPLPVDAQVMIYDYGSEVNVAVFSGSKVFVNQYENWECGDTEWDISLVKVDNVLKWTGESEYHVGPNRYEGITITYYTNPKVVHPNTLTVKYKGEDLRLKEPNLTLEDIRPILAEWEKSCAKPTPEK